MTTISACKGLPTCSKCGDILPMFDKHECNPAPTIPPTESRECNCIDCRVGRDLGLKPNYPTEPTVEKWGGDQEANKCEFCGETKPVQRYYLKVRNKHFDDNKGGCYSTFIYYCQDCGIEETHSVQEAKAEERERIAKIINSMKVTDNVSIPVCRKCSFFGTNENYCPKCGDNLTPETSTGYIDRVNNSLLDDLLSTLNTKASLKQEEGK